MKSKLTQLITDLVRYQTTNGNVAAIESCFEYVSSKLKFLDWIEKRYIQNGVESRVWLSHDTLEPDILLNAHLDVVPASEKMFSVVQNRNKLIGRGVGDMKFAIAVFIVALEELKNQNKLPLNKSIGIMITSDEEVGGPNGVGYLVNEIGYKPGCVLIPDGGDNWKLVEAAKGIVRPKIISRGISAHASRPWEGEDAIIKLAEFIQRLRVEFPTSNSETHETTVNIGNISGGIQTNQVCDYAEVILDIRYDPNEGHDRVMARINKVAKDLEVEITLRADSFQLKNPNHPLVSKWKKLIKPLATGEILIKEHGASDGRYFSTFNSPVILSKPKGGLIHTEEEWMDLDSIETYTKCVIDWLSD